MFTQCPNLQKFVAVFMAAKTETEIKEPTEWEEPQFGQQNNLKYIDFVNSRMPVSWMKFLSHFPKLQFLKTAVNNVDLFKTISIIRQHDPKMLNLKHIEILGDSIRSHYEESIRSVFLDPKLSLETIRIEAWKCQPETLLDILDLHAKSLRKLILEGDAKQHPILRYPRQPLQDLEELRATYCIFPADIFKYTPNVKKVDIRIFNPSSYPILERVESTLQVITCKELKLKVQRDCGDTPESDFAFFLKAFPNVEKLHTLELNNHKFAMICEHLPKLVSFKIKESKVDVTGLLGFDQDSKAGAVVRKPNITNLKDLQSFFMNKDVLAEVKLKNGSDLEKELKKLLHLKNFKLEDYKFQGDKKVWKEIFAKYSGH